VRITQAAVPRDAEHREKCWSGIPNRLFARHVGQTRHCIPSSDKFLLNRWTSLYCRTARTCAYQTDTLGTAFNYSRQLQRFRALIVLMRLHKSCRLTRQGHVVVIRQSVAFHLHPSDPKKGSSGIPESTHIRLNYQAFFGISSAAHIFCSGEEVYRRRSSHDA